MEDSSESSASSEGGEEVELFTQSSETEQEKKVQQVAKPQLAEKETKAVNRSKIVVYLVIFVAAISVACIIYYVLRAAQKSNYEAKVGSLQKF
jgi:t-SNARE complex subunit (syntaxin)